MSFCTKCGTKLLEAAAFCANCGTKVGAVVPAAGSSADAADGTVALDAQEVKDEGFPKKYIVWAVVVGVSLVVIYFIMAAVGPVDNVAVTLDYADQVATGEQFSIHVTLTNLVDVDQELDSIDIGHTYLDGVSVLAAEPPYSDTFDVLDGTLSHTFQEPIPASGVLEVVFHAQALNPGTYEGAFDICINGPASCVFETISVTVL